MSIIKPHKLGVIAGPGSEYFTGKVVKHLIRLYIDRYEKVTKALLLMTLKARRYRQAGSRALSTAPTSPST